MLKWQGLDLNPLSFQVSVRILNIIVSISDPFYFIFSAVKFKAGTDVQGGEEISTEISTFEKELKKALTPLRGPNNEKICEPKCFLGPKGRRVRNLKRHFEYYYEEITFTLYLSSEIHTTYSIIFTFMSMLNRVMP